MSKGTRKQAQSARGKAAAQQARERVAAQRAAARRAEVRRRALIVGGAITVVLAVVAALIAVKLARSPERAVPAATDAAVEQAISGIPAATFNTVGAGTATRLKAISGEPELTLDGKPEVLYMGGEYCPYCAAERWAVAAALDRFGVLSGTKFIHSSPTDVYPSTPTMSFYKSSYASKYVAFVPVEWYSEKTGFGDPDRLRLPAAAHDGAGRPVQQVRRRRVPVRRHRQPVRRVGCAVPAVGPGQHDLGSGGCGDAGSVQPGRQGHRRRGEHDHRGDLQADPRPARQRLQLGRSQGGGRVDLSAPG